MKAILEFSLGDEKKQIEYDLDKKSEKKIFEKAILEFDFDDEYEKMKFERMLNADSVLTAWDEFADFLRTAYKYDTIEDVEKHASRAVREEELEFLHLIREKFFALAVEYKVNLE